MNEKTSENQIILTEEQWHAERAKGLGGSDCSAIIGKNPYKTNIQLWEEKTGKRKPENISNKACVIYGNKAEAPIRELFALEHPQYEVFYKSYDLRIHPDYEFLRASLDGDLTEIETGRKGILEIKTTNILQSMQKEKWDGKIPDNYFCQVLHNMFVRVSEFGVVSARLLTKWDKELRAIEKRYHVERDEIIDSMNYLIEKEIKFWEYNVLRDIPPALILPEL